MTEASYTAWDDKQYVWPPPDGWYEAPDGKWWPKGYGPPQVKEETPAAAVVERPVRVEEPAVEEPRIAEPHPTETHPTETHPLESQAAEPDVAALADTANQRFTASTAGPALTDTGSDVAGGWLTDAPAALDQNQQDLAPVEQAADAVVDPDASLSAIFDRTDDAMAKAAEAVANVPGVDSAIGDVAEHENGDAPAGEGTARTGDLADAAEATIIDKAGSVTDSASGAINEQAETIVGSDSFDASTSAATHAFGTGLMPPMADRPAPAMENGQPAHSLDSPQTTPYQDPVDPSSPEAGFDRLAAAAPATAPPNYDAATGQQAMLASQGKGSSRGLLFAILGVLLLVGIGAALFFALGGDGDAGEASEESIVTGPGSVNEPHPRATGVVVFYPDSGVEQRWIVEVLEPVRDATDELGATDGNEIYAATRIRVSNESGIDGASVEDLRFNVVDASNSVIVRSEHNCPASADDLNYQASVALGSSVEGTVCWAVPADDLAGLKLGIESSKVQGRVHIQLQ